MKGTKPLVSGHAARPSLSCAGRSTASTFGLRHLARAGSDGIAIGAFALTLFLTSLAHAQGCLDTLGALGTLTTGASANPPGSASADAQLDSALQAAQAMRYDEAARLFASPSLKRHPVALCFEGLLWMQRAEDLGDTAAFHRAHARWDSLWNAAARPDFGLDSLTRALLRGLVGLQGAATDQHYGRTWHAVRLSLKAKSLLNQALPCPEAEAALALLDYYRDQLLPSWVPMGGDAATATRTLREASLRLRRLRPVFTTAWIWTQFDRGEWAAGHAALTTSLRSYPSHRLYLQMRGDFLFREKKLDSALTRYREALAQYLASPAAPKPNPVPGLAPVGYLACVGNLARIHHAMGHADSAAHYLAIWKDPAYARVTPWLPLSLKKALQGLR